MLTKSSNRRFSILALAIASIVTGPEAQAADQPIKNNQRYTLEEIVVTARRKEETIDSVPITITAFDQNSLKEKSINTTQDLQAAVPGVFLTGSGSRTNTLYSIRGQSRPVTGAGSPGVVT